MVERYFEKFPLVNYSNNDVVDITRRVVLLNTIAQNPYVFYPYDITEHERADNLSSRYYRDAYMSWLLYLGNEIVDPYYEWYMDQNQFNDYIQLKYDTREAAEKIKYFRHEWASATTLTVSAYNALAGVQKNYWEPYYSSSGSIMYYTRKKKDWIVNTNRIVAYTVANVSFTTDEVISIVFDNTYTGNGQVLSTNSTAVFVQHLQGTYDSNATVLITANSYVYGNESGVNVAFTDATVISTTLEDEEEAYWEPVTYWTYEEERNEYNKSIRVVDGSLAQVAADNLRELLKDP